MKPRACMLLKQRLIEALSMPMMPQAFCAEIEPSMASSTSTRQLSMPTSKAARYACEAPLESLLAIHVR
ncbi:hypothetical protein D3C72_2569980 [compost metagenome]